MKPCLAGDLKDAKNELNAAIHLLTIEHLPKMRANGRKRDVQLRYDLLVAAASQNQFDYGRLSRRQLHSGSDMVPFYGTQWE